MKERKTGSFITTYGKFILILALVLLVGVVLIYMTYRGVKREIIDNLNARQMIHARQAARGIETFFHDHIAMLQQLAKNEHMIDLDAAGKRIMRDFYSFHADTISIVTRIDRQGRILHPEPYDAAVIGKPVVSIASFQEAQRTGQVSVSNVFTNLRGLKTIIVHVPVFKGGAFNGTIAILLPFDLIAARYVEDIRSGRDGYAWVISRDGTELSCPVPGHTGNSVFDNCRDFPDILALAKRMMRGEQGVATYEFDRIRGDAVRKTIKHAVFMPIRIADNFWSIVIATPEDEVMVTLEGFRNRLLLITLLLMVAMGICIFMLFRNRTLFEENKRRQEAEDALRESEALQKSIFLAAPVGIGIVSNRIIKQVNDLICEMTGYAREELIDKSARIFYPTDEDFEFVGREKYAQISKWGTGAVETRWMRKDGLIIDVLLSSTPLDPADLAAGVTFTALDISKRKQMDADLQASEQRYRGIFENAVEGIYQSTPEGRFLAVNPAMARMCGYESPQAMMAVVTDIANQYYVDPRDRETYKTLLDANGSIDNIEYRVQRRDGGFIWVSGSARVVRNKQGDTLYYEGRTQNITARKWAEEERRKLEAQLLQAQKMESIGTLAGGIAHDFNNLLMGIQGYASLMLVELDAAHPHYERLQAIERQVASGAELTRQLLGFARGGRYEVRPTDMNELIKKTAAMFGRTKKEIRIHEKYCESLWAVDADRGQMDQVLLNLFVNAWQAMPGGGDLFLETDNVHLDAAYTAPYEIKPGSYVKVSITDTGVGMDEKTRQRIFDPFFTTKEMGRGTGLGLASVYGIIKGHVGFIHVYSEQGHGTTFNIYLPASSQEVVRQAPPSTDATRRGHETILLVDDERMILDVTREMLEGLGYRILVAQSGADALGIYRADHGKIDLAILDMIMPDMGGGELFDRMKAVNPDCRVILSSGYSLNGEARTILARGVKLFLQKPFRLDDLSQKVRKALEE